MRKTLLPALTGIVVAAVVATLAASSAAHTIGRSSDPGLTSGTPRHPQGVKLMVDLGWQGLSASTQPILTNLNMWFPHGAQYNGARYPSCSVRTLDAAGPQGCPKGSIMGHGSGTAYADTTITRPSITVVNGGSRIVWFYTVLNNPARVQEPVPGYITRVGGDFTYHLSVTIPDNLRIVAGVPIELTNLNVTAGRSKWLAITSPPSGVKIVASFSNGATITDMVFVQDS